MKNFAVTIIFLLGLGSFANATDRKWNEVVANAPVHRANQLKLLVACQDLSLIHHSFNLSLSSDEEWQSLGNENQTQNFVVRSEAPSQYSISLAATDDIQAPQILITTVNQRDIDAACAKPDEVGQATMMVSVQPGTQLQYSYSERACVQEPVDAYILGFAVAYKKAQCTLIAHGQLSRGNLVIPIRTIN